MKTNEVVSEQVSANKEFFTLDMEIPLLQRILKHRNIGLSEWLRIHDEVLPYISAVASSGSSTKIHDEYLEFFDVWGGGLLVDSRNIDRCRSYLEETAKELEELLSTLTPSFLERGISTIDSTEPRKTNAALDSIYRNYWNSVFKYNDIDFSVGEWIQRSLTLITRDLDRINALDSLSPEELIAKYDYTLEDLNKVYELFESVGTTSWDSALATIPPQLENEREERAYLRLLTSVLGAYASGLPLTYWFAPVQRSFRFLSSRK